MTDPHASRFPFSDVALARRLERAEAHSNAKFVEARAKLFPESGAQWIEVAGAYAMFDTVSSPLTQTFGLGVFEKVTSSEMQRIEEFYQQRGTPVFHEISPLADPGLLALLNERGYHPIELTSVMYRPIREDFSLAASRNEKIQVRLVREDEHELCAKISARGWSEHPELTDFLLEIGQISAQREGTLSFFAEMGGQPIAASVLCIGDGVALLGGACTIPEARKHGAQLALLESRLRYAAEQGCDLAMMCAQPGSASQRNAERHGFRIAYTRIKWRLA
jgi:hypothetical protein